MKPVSTKLDIEKCVQNAHSHFDLILMAAARAREISKQESILAKQGVKPTIRALYEIEHGQVGRELLRKVGARRGK